MLAEDVLIVGECRHHAWIGVQGANLRKVAWLQRRGDQAPSGNLLHAAMRMSRHYYFLRTIMRPSATPSITASTRESFATKSLIARSARVSASLTESSTIAPFHSTLSTMMSPFGRILFSISS